MLRSRLELKDRQLVDAGAMVVIVLAHEEDPFGYVHQAPEAWVQRLVSESLGR